MSLNGMLPSNRYSRPVFVSDFAFGHVFPAFVFRAVQDYLCRNGYQNNIALDVSICRPISNENACLIFYHHIVKGLNRFYRWRFWFFLGKFFLFRGGTRWWHQRVYQRSAHRTFHLRPARASRQRNHHQRNDEFSHGSFFRCPRCSFEGIMPDEDKTAKYSISQKWRLEVDNPYVNGVKYLTGRSYFSTFQS